MGVITGKGLSELTVKYYGLRITFFVLAALVALQFFRCHLGLARVAPSMGLFNVSKFISVPIACDSGVVRSWSSVTTKKLEKIFLVSIISLHRVYHHWHFSPSLIGLHRWSLPSDTCASSFVGNEFRNSEYLYAVDGNHRRNYRSMAGSFICRHRSQKKAAGRSGLKYTQADAIVGSIFSVLIAGFIIVRLRGHFISSWTIHKFRNAGEAAQSLRPLGGDYAFTLFAIGLLNASLFAASILPLSTAYTVCEAMGFESGLNKRFKNAPAFYWLYTALLGIGAVVILIPDFPLIRVAILSQVLNGILLPFVLVFVLLLASKPELMGKFINPRAYQAAAWAIAAVITAIMGWMLIAQR